MEINKKNKRSPLFYIAIIIWILVIFEIGFLINRYVVNSPLCPRTSPYDMPEEFNRAFSLIIQRFEESPLEENKKVARAFKSIRNCLDIQYERPGEDMMGAEGFFAFNKNSSIERLQIFVSPKYSIKDDILTATLLVHEMTHALFHVNGKGEELTCYGNEAVAFLNQFAFQGLLNDEERSSLWQRNINNSSKEVSGLFYTLHAINNIQGNSFVEKANDYVKNDPFYQKQCQAQ